MDRRGFLKSLLYAPVFVAAQAVPGLAEEKEDPVTQAIKGKHIYLWDGGYVRDAVLEKSSITAMGSYCVVSNCYFK